MTEQQRLALLTESIKWTKEHIVRLKKHKFFDLVQEWEKWLDYQLDSKTKLESELEEEDNDKEKVLDDDENCWIEYSQE